MDISHCQCIQTWLPTNNQGELYFYLANWTNVSLLISTCEYKLKKISESLILSQRSQSWFDLESQKDSQQKSHNQKWLKNISIRNFRFSKLVVVWNKFFAGQCRVGVFWPISDKRIYSLYRTRALLYIKLYNAKYPENLSHKKSFRPGPFAPPLSNLPSLKMTALSYSWTTWNQNLTFHFLENYEGCRVKLLEDLERVDGTNIWSREALKSTGQHPMGVNKEQLDGPPVLLLRTWSSMLM